MLKYVDLVVGFYVCATTTGIVSNAMRYEIAAPHWTTGIGAGEAWFLTITLMSFAYCGGRCIYFAHKKRR